jgi:hypothetical protein
VKPFRETDVVPAVRAAVARHRELLTALRAVGDRPLKAIFMNVPSQNGGDWPLKILRREDGSLDIRGAGA